jgi:hypothetical protein
VVEQVAKASLPHGPDRERVGEHDRALDGPELRELRETGRLAVAVHDVAGAQHLVLVEVAAVRQDRRDPRAQPLALDQGPVAHEHARHVHQRVQLASGEAADRIAELT